MELQNLLNPEQKGKPQLQSASRVFRVGDKVMQVRNNYEIVWNRIGGEQGVGAYNGDIGIVESINMRDRSMVVRMDEMCIRDRCGRPHPVHGWRRGRGGGPGQTAHRPPPGGAYQTVPRTLFRMTRTAPECRNARRGGFAVQSRFELLRTNMVWLRRSSRRMIRR